MHVAYFRQAHDEMLYQIIQQTSNAKTSSEFFRQGAISVWLPSSMYCTKVVPIQFYVVQLSFDVKKHLFIAYLKVKTTRICAFNSLYTLRNMK